MTRKIVALAASLVLTAGAVLAGASPAQAWTYCNPNTPANVLYLFDNQGLCGTSAGFSIANMPPNTCLYITSPYGNWAGSVYNKTGRNVILSDAINCTGASQGIPPWGIDQDLYANPNIGNKVSSALVV